MSFATVLLATLLAAPDAPAAVTFSRDIAPIFQQSCQACHRPGEAAPMPLFTYADARPWARKIKNKVQKREMPPWHADPTHGKWRNDRRLADEDLTRIVSWVDAGAPEGDPKDLPPPREFVEGWNIGKPDAVFTMPREFTVKAKGEVSYQYFVVPTDFTEDKWIQAAEARPGNRAVVHHIIVFIQEPGKRGLEQRNLWSTHLCGTAPGEEADVFPAGTAKRIKAGSKLVFQVHYTPSGTVATDRSMVGLRFAREPVKRQLIVGAVMNQRFRIPPGASEHEVQASYTFREDSTIWTFMPHMHLRGKDFRYDLVFPDGRRETALRVPRWDFNWQHTYYMQEPLKVPKGARIECTAHYDNSAGNKANPDPAKMVRWGDQTWEEMMIGFVSFTRAAEDLAVDPQAAPEKRPPGKATDSKNPEQGRTRAF